MNKAITEIQKIEFDLTDPELTTCRVTYKGHGDVPINAMGGVKQKSFPARKSVLEILQEELPGFLLW